MYTAWARAADLCSDMTELRGLAQIQTKWYMGEDMTLPPVTVPEDCQGDTLTVMNFLSVLVRDCTAREPSMRPSFQQVLERIRPLMALSGGLPSAPSC